MLKDKADMVVNIMPPGPGNSGRSHWLVEAITPLQYLKALKGD
jgi:hypothetical protein